MRTSADDKIQMAMVQQSLQATERRLRMAFPELVSLFWVMAAGTAKDVAWRETFDAYASSASLALVKRLQLEISDLLQLGLSDVQLGSFVGALGFDATALDDRTRNTRGFLTALGDCFTDALRAKRSAV